MLRNFATFFMSIRDFFPFLRSEKVLVGLQEAGYLQQLG